MAFTSVRSSLERAVGYILEFRTWRSHHFLQATICDVHMTIPGHDVDVMAHVSNSNYVHVTVNG
jgi:hypothetical protein